MTTTTIYLLHANDCSTIVDEYHFTSEEAAHTYMSAECLHERYALAKDFDKMIDEL